MGNGKPFLWRLPISSFVLKIGRAISACLKNFLSQVICLSRSITTKLSVLGVFLPRFYNANFLMWCVRTHLVLLVWSVLAWGIKPLPLSLKKTANSVSCSRSSSRFICLFRYFLFKFFFQWSYASLVFSPWGRISYAWDLMPSSKDAVTWDWTLSWYSFCQ